jgi:hypothetical protein
LPSNSPARALLIDRSSRSSSSARRWHSSGVPNPDSESRSWAVTACLVKVVQCRTGVAALCSSANRPQSEARAAFPTQSAVQARSPSPR